MTQLHVYVIKEAQKNETQRALENIKVIEPLCYMREKDGKDGYRNRLYMREK